MAIYKCFGCGKRLSHKVLQKPPKITCPFCNSKIFYKPRIRITKVKAV